LETLPPIGLPRLALGAGPTPVRRLGGGVADAAEVWVKEDGSYGPHGGNKARKLEWLLAAALRRGRRPVITGGALGTNHGLATALYARDLGVRAILVLVPQPEDEHVRRQLGRLEASGAELHRAPGPGAGLLVAAGLVARNTRPPLRLPYLMPPGGSTAFGCLGYVEAGLELGRQVRDGELPEPERIVVAVGTGGTAAGLVLGLKLAGLASRVTGVLVNDVTPVSARGIARLARRAGRLLRRRAGLTPPPVTAADLDLSREWLGPGYGHATPEADAAIASLTAAGCRTDPVYTGKAAAGLVAMGRRGDLGTGPVLFWNTYGGEEE
jgi:D-cysteine desulfhydrase